MGIPLRSFAVVALLSILVGATAPLAHIGEVAGAVPAPPTGGPRPTIGVSPTHAYAGQSVTVTGQGVSPSTGVRVAWLLDDATLNAAEVASTPGSNAYSASITVPDQAALGATKVCATVTGQTQAEFACADFNVDTPPPGRVQGNIPLEPALADGARPQDIAASVNLVSKLSDVVVTAPINANGSFVLDNVPPGQYEADVIGVIPRLVESLELDLKPAGVEDLVFKNPLCEEVRVANITGGPRSLAKGRTFDFGSYVALPGGSANNVTFEAHLQLAYDAGGSTPAVERIEWEVRQTDNKFSSIGSSTTSPYRFTYNVSQLPSGISSIRAVPVVDGVRLACGEKRKTINVIADPMAHPSLQPGARTTWDATNQRYNFSGVLPNVGGALPIIYPNPPPKLPLVGTIENKLSAGLRIEGNLALNGDVRVQLMRAEVVARLASQNVFDKGVDLLPSGANRLVSNPSDPLRAGLDFGPTSLYKFDKEITVFSGVLATYFGIVTVNLGVKIGIGGELILQGTIRPLQPAIDTMLTASVTPRLGVSIWVDILLGVASAGADAQAQAELRLGLRINTEETPPVSIPTPCLRLGVSLKPWAAVNLFLWKERWELDPIPLVRYQTPDCPPGYRALTPAATVPAPRVMASPDVAIGPGGGCLAVYVEDATPNAEIATPRVMTRFQNPQTGAWEAATALTDGGHMVQDPVAAFVGPDGSAIVAWTQNTMSRAEDEAAGADINIHLRRQEIFYALWDVDAQRWTTPTQLTNDGLADGRAALAGDELGATLAWTRDTDGNIATRTDWRIATRELDLDGAFLPMELLSGAAPGTPPDGLNAQVSVTRQSGQSYLAWSFDVDGEPRSNGDRRIAVGRQTPNGWQISLPPDLPVGADSPNVATDPNQQLKLAFLVRGKDADGETDTGIGDQAVVWSAVGNTNGGWQVAPVLDGSEPVRGERPRLSVGPNGEVLLLFRRFGVAGTNGELGQLALTQLEVPTGSVPLPPSFKRPLYLTDEPRQHWQPAFAINQATGRATVLNVSRAGIIVQGGLQAASPAAPSGFGTMALAEGTDPVESLVIEPGADPALDPALQLGQQHAVVGSTVAVTATVRNLGRAPATNLQVRFYEGTPETGTLLLQRDLTETLGFNEARAVVAQLTRRDGRQPISAVVTTSGGDNNAANNGAQAALGELPPPTMVTAAQSTRYSNALEISWMPPAVAGVAGYRILRSSTPNGAYELVGEATGTVYTDTLLQPGQTYYYVVQAYDGDGVRSAYSAQASGTLPTAPPPPPPTPSPSPTTEPTTPVPSPSPSPTSGPSPSGRQIFLPLVQR